MVRIGINGFGRTGRAAARISLNHPEVQLVAINSRADAESHAYLLQYDSIYGSLELPITAKGGKVFVGNQQIDVYQKPVTEEIPWHKSQVDLVLECSGKFKTFEEVKGHLESGVKKVIISAPAKDSTIPMVVLGVNEETINGETRIISNASCTTNCLAVVCKVLDDQFQIKRGFMTTIHSPTDSQNILDNSNKKIRLRRTSALSIIPSTTGASKALGKVLPQLAGKISCQSLRVPPFSASLVDLTIEVNKNTTVEEINNTFIQASRNELKGYLQVLEDELVGADIQGNPHSAILDPFLTDVVDKNLVKVFAWYDNEWGYSARLVDLAAYLFS